MNYYHPKEEVLGSEFIFNRVYCVEINWSNSLDFEPKLYDCSFDHAMSGLDVYVICLKNGVLPDEKDLVFYNNFSNTDESIEGDYGYCYADYPGFDQCFWIIPSKLTEKYDEILFVIGRPKTRNEKNTNWIDHDLVRKVTDEICYVDCKILQWENEYHTIRNIKFEYNKNGATVLFKFEKNNSCWTIDLSHNIYNNGLKEIIEKHSNMHYNV
jgi:hypothetical protein